MPLSWIPHAQTMLWLGRGTDHIMVGTGQTMLWSGRGGPSATRVWCACRVRARYLGHVYQHRRLLARHESSDLPRTRRAQVRNARTHSNKNNITVIVIIIIVVVISSPRHARRRHRGRAGREPRSWVAGTRVKHGGRRRARRAGATHAPDARATPARTPRDDARASRDARHACARGPLTSAQTARARERLAEVKGAVARAPARREPWPNRERANETRAWEGGS